MKVGDKVICVSNEDFMPHITGEIPSVKIGSIHTVLAILICPKCKIPSVDIGIQTHWNTAQCECGFTHPSNGIMDCDMGWFRVIEETEAPFPAMSYTKILECEKEFVSMN